MSQPKGERFGWTIALALLAATAAIQVVGVDHTGSKATESIDQAQRYGSWIPYWHTPLSVTRPRPKSLQVKPTAKVDTVRLIETDEALSAHRLEALTIFQPCTSESSGRSLSVALPDDGFTMSGPVVVIRAENQSRITEIERVARCANEQILQGRVVSTSLSDTDGFVGARSNGTSWLAGSINSSDAFSGLQISHRVALSASSDLGLDLWDQVEIPAGTVLTLKTPFGRSVAHALDRFGGSVVDTRTEKSELGFTFSGSAEDLTTGDPNCAVCDEHKDLQTIALALQRSPSQTQRPFPALAIGDAAFAKQASTSLSVQSVIQEQLATQKTPLSFPTELTSDDGALSLNTYLSLTNECFVSASMNECFRVEELTKQLTLLRASQLKLVLLSPGEAIQSFINSDTEPLTGDRRIRAFLQALLNIVKTSAPRATVFLVSDVDPADVGPEGQTDPAGQTGRPKRDLTQILGQIAALDSTGVTHYVSAPDIATNGFIRSYPADAQQELAFYVLPLSASIRSALFFSPDNTRSTTNDTRKP